MAYINATGTVLGTNIFTYCENNSITNFDNSGNWCEKSSGFKRTKKGFGVNEKKEFLSRTYCLLYAADFLHRYGTWHWYGKTYSGMTCLRIAQEIWFHALVYYIGKPIKKVLSWCNISWSKLDSFINSAKYIDVNSDDNRAWAFKAAWYFGAFIKCNLIKYSIGPMKYIKLIVL